MAAPVGTRCRRFCERVRAFAPRDLKVPSSLFSIWNMGSCGASVAIRCAGSSGLSWKMSSSWTGRNPRRAKRVPSGPSSRRRAVRSAPVPLARPARHERAVPDRTLPRLRRGRFAPRGERLTSEDESRGFRARGSRREASCSKSGVPPGSRPAQALRPGEDGPARVRQGVRLPKKFVDGRLRSKRYGRAGTTSTVSDDGRLNPQALVLPSIPAPDRLPMFRQTTSAPE